MADYSSISFSRRLRDAISDMANSLAAVYFWGFLGWHDIRQRYRRSTLGPMWITASTGVMVAAIGLLYSQILHTDLNQYLPYLAIGLITWGLISTTINESCTVFIGAEAGIKSNSIPLTAHVLRLVWRNVIVFGHNLLIVAVVLALFPSRIGWEIVFVLPAILLVALNGVWMGLFLGVLCTRFRDVAQIVINVMQIAFYVTPVIWHADVLKGHHWAVDLNPFYYLLETMRAPILGGGQLAHVFGMTALMTLAGFSITLLFFARFRSRVAYWL
ncbi:MAG: ABC transporter permease [Hydrogenophilales bacterium]|nr:ABC transporter permease [Hydrogenophilales bacterium]